MGYPTLVESFLRAVEQYPTPRAQLERTAAGWEAISSAELLRRVAGLATALERLGVAAGDRVLLYAPNRPEWHTADFAILGLGAVTVPVYFRESADRLVYIAAHSEAEVAFVSGEEQLRQLEACRARLPRLRAVIAARAPRSPEWLSYEDLVGRATGSDLTAYRRRAQDIEPGQLASIIYTSGTTGEPKGVMLTHQNFTSNVFDALGPLRFHRDDIALSFLPLSHVFERMIDYGYLFHGVPVAYVDSLDRVERALREIRPTVAAAVPRVFQKLYAGIMSERERLTGRRRQLLEWSLQVAAASIPWLVYGQRPVRWRLVFSWLLADLLVYRRIRERLGGRIRLFISGGAALGRELVEFFWSIGVPVYQGYGLTETSPAVSSNIPGQNKPGTVGRPIRNVEVRIAEDGEILVRGPCVMQGYYRAPEETRAVITEDGWFHTGDVGYLDEDGYLVITDRKKELLKTSGGKLVAPQPIENLLRSSPYIANACVVGEGQRFVAALVVPNFPALLQRAREQGIELNGPAEAIRHPWVRALIAREIEQRTASLAQYERPKRFALLEQDFSVDAGELTYTQKLRRRIIEQRYAAVIEQLFAERPGEAVGELGDWAPESSGSRMELKEIPHG